MQIQSLKTKRYEECRLPDRGWYSLMRSYLNRAHYFVFSPASLSTIDFSRLFRRLPSLGLLVTMGMAGLGGAASLAWALQSVELSWQNSPNTNVVAYNVYFGTQSGQYGTPISFGDAVDVTLPGFVEGTTYYFAVSAVDAEGNESILSNEDTYTVPVPGAYFPPGPGSEADFRVGRHAILKNGMVSFDVDYLTYTLFSAESDNFERGTKMVGQGFEGGANGPAVTASADDKVKGIPGLNDASTAPPLSASMVLQTQIIPDENGQPYEMEINTYSAVDGAWEMDASTDLQNWTYYTSGTGSGNGDGHDVEVCVPIDTSAPQMFFRVVQ
jgi:hypothetical protein